MYRFMTGYYSVMYPIIIHSLLLVSVLVEGGKWHLIVGPCLLPNPFPNAYQRRCPLANQHAIAYPHTSLLSPPPPHLIQPLGRIILGTNRQSLPLTRRLIRHLHNIHQLLLILNLKVYLVIVPRAKVDLNVLVPPEKHDCARR
jgi:hypothetical protein